MALIKTAIELEDRISKPLADVTKSLEVTARTINNIGTKGGPDAAGLTQYFVSLKNGIGTTTEHTRSVTGLTSGYRILNLALREAGIQVGGFRALSMAAQTGLVGLGVAVTGAVLVALEKLADKAAVVKQRLEDMVGKGTGDRLASQFRQGEVAANAAVGGMAEAAEAIARGIKAMSPIKTIVQDANGDFIVSAGLLKDLSVVTQTWSKELQLGKMNADDAAKGVNQIAQAIFKLQATKFARTDIVISPATGLAEYKQVEDVIYKTQGLTAETYDLIEKLSPRMAEDWAKAFNFSSVDAFRNSLALMPRTSDEVLRATEKLTAGVNQTYNSLDAGNKTLGQNATELKNAAENTASLAGSNVKLGTTLGVFADQLKYLNSYMSATKEGGPALEALDEAFNTVVKSSDGLKSSTSILDMLTEAFKQLYDSITSGSAPAVTSIDAVISELVKAKSQANSGTGAYGLPSNWSGGSFFEPPGGATGGLFWGRNPGVDTNLAWLTRFEYIMNPAAVRKYGVNFMHMINSLQFPIRGFAEGGLNLMDRVSISPPSISAMQSSRSLTLVLDTKRFNISGNKSTIDALEREATLRGISAAGIAPGWVR